MADEQTGLIAGALAIGHPVLTGCERSPYVVRLRSVSTISLRRKRKKGISE
jgi:hypothetical protein